MAKLERSYKALHRKIERMERMGEVTIANNYKKLLADIKTSMAQIYDTYEIDGQLTMQQLNKYNRIDKLDKNIAKMVSKLYASNNKVIRATLRGVVSDTYKGNIDLVRNELGQKVPRLKGIMKPIDVTRVINKDMKGLHWAQRQTHHRNDVIYQIQKEVKAGLTDGNTYAQVGKRLQAKLDISEGKAMQIARTETHRVQSDAKQKSFDEITKGGVKANKKWLTSNDEAVRSQHSPMYGQIVGLDEDFIYPDGSRAKQPGMSGVASQDINCRCISILTFEDVTP